MADNDTRIPRGASPRNLFPKTVAHLAVQASRAQLLELCRQALADGVPRDEIAAFLNQVDADCRAMIAAAMKGRGQ